MSDVLKPNEAETCVWRGEAKLGDRTILVRWFSADEEDRLWLRHFVDDAKRHPNPDYRFEVIRFVPDSDVAVFQFGSE